MPHHIRLGPPWEVAAAGGRAVHRRRFGRPTNLGPGDEVWLVCDAVPGPAAVAVNGVAVGASADITPLLRPRNEVVVDAADGPLGEVRLEIRGPG